MDIYCLYTEGDFETIFNSKRDYENLLVYLYRI
jgi:hypothetical protein